MGRGGSETETWYCNEVPRSPWTKWVTQSQYCVTRGRSVPAAWLKRSTSCWLAKLPRTFRPTSPGKSEDAAEHEHAEDEQRDQRIAEPLQQEPVDPSLLRSQAPGRRARRRPGLERNRAPALPERRLRQIERADRRGFEALDLLRARLRPVVEVRDDHRRVPQEQPAGDCPCTSAALSPSSAAE